MTKTSLEESFTIYSKFLPTITFIGPTFSTGSSDLSEGLILLLSKLSIHYPIYSTVNFAGLSSQEYLSISLPGMRAFIKGN